MSKVRRKEAEKLNMSRKYKVTDNRLMNIRIICFQVRQEGTNSGVYKRASDKCEILISNTDDDNG